MSTVTEANHLPGHTHLRPSEASAYELEQEDLAYLACYFDDVEIYLDAMRLCPHEKADVRRAVVEHGHQVGMNRCLEYWHQPNPAAATFTALRSMLIKLRKQDIADAVGEYFKSKRQEMLSLL